MFRYVFIGFVTFLFNIALLIGVVSVVNDANASDLTSVGNIYCCNKGVKIVSASDYVKNDNSSLFFKGGNFYKIFTYVPSSSKYCVFTDSPIEDVVCN